MVYIDVSRFSEPEEAAIDISMADYSEHDGFVDLPLYMAGTR